jgi:endonuclease/exonuclease/phosphatase (EEP) superfamily protein YafD
MHRSPSVRAWFALRVAGWLYVALLCGWAVTRSLAGDRWWWLFTLNSLAVYLFVPAPAVLLIAVLRRRVALVLGAFLALALGLVLYGHLFLPALGRAEPSGCPLAVMTYNVLGFNDHPDRVVAAVRAADSDLVALQELSPAMAEAIRQTLSAAYPYQQLDPQEGVSGLGIISRYPLYQTGEELAGHWVGRPQMLQLQLCGASVTVIHAHPYATNPGPPSGMEASIAAREGQARVIRDYARSHPGPLIVPLDLNASPQSVAYALVTDELQDAWRAAGWGLGHTFPGAAGPGSSRPALAGIPAPRWLVRIDYLFHSDHFVAVEATLGPWDGSSDHRPVLARLVLLDALGRGPGRP